jgi:hypothetical protein
MAAIYVDSAGGAPSTPFASWADAAATLEAALAVATASDIIYVDDGHAESRTTAMNLLFPITAGLRVVSVDKALGATPSTVSAGAVVEIATGAVAMDFNGCALIYGVTFLGTASVTTAGVVRFGNGTDRPTALAFDTCSLRVRSNNSGASFLFGGTSASTSDECEVTFINTTLGLANSGSRYVLTRARVILQGCSLIDNAPVSLFRLSANSSSELEAVGCDFSGLAYTNLVDAAASNIAGTARFVQCKLRASTVTLTTAQVVNGTKVFLHDCHSGDTHTQFEYHDALGSVVSDDVIKLSAGAAGQSWKITTTPNATFANPFKTPWISLYHTGTSAIEPYLEFLRNNDSTSSTYDDDEVWIDVIAKTTTGSTQGTLYTDRMALLGSPVAQTSSALGASDWAGESGTCAYGVIKAPSLTPAENGHLMARICVGLASLGGKLHVDPQIRT